MYKNKVKVKRALLSVSDKTGIVELAKRLTALKIEILSTGGTCQLLQDSQIPVREVAELTQFPEIMAGRVKTLHPKIHGGILGRRDEHQAVADKHEIEWIDLVVVNLYPFAKTIAQPEVTFADAIENIDIGGPAMIRSAAKNLEWTAVIVDPSDYEMLLQELENQAGLLPATRLALATKAFGHTAQYDAMIHRYFSPSAFPPRLMLSLEKVSDLRYGENPQQAAAAYQYNHVSAGILSAIQHQGKQLSYNNLMDGDAALACLAEFVEPACVIVKHANPCGAAIGLNIEDAFTRAFQADSLSAFGGIVVLNRSCTREIAEAIDKVFIEVLIAPAFNPDALVILQRKTNLRILECTTEEIPKEKQEVRSILGGLLIQEKDQSPLTIEGLQLVTICKPTSEHLKTMLFAWQVLKYIKSNAVLIVADQVTQGVGAGQVSRIDAVKLAIQKAGPQVSNSILASDAFFPFRDSIDQIAAAGIKTIIQPGGSIRDHELIAACNEHQIAMAFTGVRCFKH